MNNKFSCIVCGHKKLRPILVGRNDLEYRVATKLDYFRCKNFHCFHVQALPIPGDSLVSSFYSAYTTHDDYYPEGLARILDVYSQHIAKKQLRFLAHDFDGHKNIRILDFGCGNGANLKRLLNLGYENIIGFDFDPQAVSFVLSQGILCCKNFDELPKKSFDVIFMNHVIEHLPDPASTLKKVSTLLVPGGIIMIRTPNSLSLLSRLCGVNWRGWETPRHLNIFTLKSLRITIDANPNLEVKEACTSNDMLAAIAIASLPPILCKFELIKIFGAVMLFISAKVTGFFSALTGEEIVCKIKMK